MNCPCTPIAQSFQTPAAHNSLTTHPWDKATECQEQTARPHGKDLDLERRLSLHRALVALLPRRVPFAFPRRQIFFALGRRRSQLCLLPSTKNKRPNRQRLHYLPLFRLTHTAHRRTHPQCAPPTPTPTPAPTPARTPTPFLNSRQGPRSSTQQHAHRGPAHTLVPSGAAPHTPLPRAAQPHVRQRYTALVQCAVFFCPSSPSRGAETSAALMANATSLLAAAGERPAPCEEDATAASCCTVWSSSLPFHVPCSRQRPQQMQKKHAHA